MTVLELLQNARQLLSNPARWTRTCFARNAEGQAVGPENPTADCWCTVGAIMRASRYDHDCVDIYAPSTTFSRTHVLLRQLLSKHPLGCADIPTFNDHPDTTHADVLALFDRAIEHCSALSTQSDDPDRFAINTAPGQ